MPTADSAINEKSSNLKTVTLSEGKLNDGEEDLGPILTDAERNRVLRKIDFHILPFVSLLYLLSFLHVTFFFLRPLTQSC